MKYKDGKMEGLYLGWHGNGEKFIEVKYKDGMREGLYVSWHSNGEKSGEVNTRMVIVMDYG